jgi:hypothetical protein
MGKQDQVNRWQIFYPQRRGDKSLWSSRPQAE